MRQGGGYVDEKNTDFTCGSIVHAIVLISVPLILGELLQNLYNSGDALIVGNFVDQHALATVTVCGVTANLIVNFFNGVSVGSNVVTAKVCGSGDPVQMKRTVIAAFSVGTVLGIVLSLLGIIFAPQLLQLAGAQEH